MPKITLIDPLVPDHAVAPSSVGFCKRVLAFLSLLSLGCVLWAQVQSGGMRHNGMLRPSVTMVWQSTPHTDTAAVAQLPLPRWIGATPSSLRAQQRSVMSVPVTRTKVSTHAIFGRGRQATKQQLPPVPESRPTAYWALAGTFGVCALVCTVEPSLLTSQLTGLTGPGALWEGQVRATASFLPIAATIAGALAAAQDNPRQLASATYERLETALVAGCIAVVGAAAVAEVASGCVKTPLLAVVSALGAAGTALPAKALAERGLNPGTILRSTFEDARQGVNVLAKRTGTGQYFATNLAITFLVGGSFAFSPKSPLALSEEIVGPETPAAFLLRSEFGVAALFALGPALGLLQEAAERGNLKAPIYRALCIAAGVATINVDVNTVLNGQAQLEAMSANGVSFEAVDVSQVPNLISALAIAGVQAGVYLYQGFVPLDGEVSEDFISREESKQD
eukprot:gnl/MRDRNA2_/MRDRNA2_99284_c0_seq1.p1 gnl/MRDRNA2_/MRDRNA2_99284_c0~~gnl/MRDRNA2_/MRDRNA2_99284_c0_seq1.p1  ORF type:complete len:468 (+),score=64.76 gnl/MRDRNA2_/MRDRNA2_99284_c0_seq1:54-1406(+)